MTSDWSHEEDGRIAEFNAKEDQAFVDMVQKFVRDENMAVTKEIRVAFRIDSPEESMGATQTLGAGGAVTTMVRMAVKAQSLDVESKEQKSLKMSLPRLTSFRAKVSREVGWRA